MKKIFAILLVLFLLQPPVVKATGGHIAIRQSVTGAEFYDTETGKSVLFNGTNYQRLDETGQLADFNVGMYSHELSEVMFSEIKALRFNVVRVSVMSKASYINGALNPDYVANVVDFLRLAEAQDIYVILAFSWTPIELHPPTDPAFDSAGMNRTMLAPGVAEAKSVYMAGFFDELIFQNAPLDVIAGVFIENEPSFDLTKLPFITVGPVITAAGTYTLPAERNAMIDANMIRYMNTVRAAVKSVAPNILVGMSLGPPELMGRFGFFTRTSGLLSGSQADFFGINMYPPFTSVDANMASLGPTTKPLIMSEYGAYQTNYPTVQLAVDALIAMRVETCRQYSFRGWLQYPWDTYELRPATDLWMGNEQGLAGSINTIDPCQPTKPATVGRVDSVSPQGVVTGIIADPDAIGSTVVNLWDTTGGWLYSGTAATRYERPDLFYVFTWPKSPMGWIWKIPPALMTDGLTHTLYAYAADRNPDGSFSSYLLGGQNPFTAPKH